MKRRLVAFRRLKRLLTYLSWKQYFALNNAIFSL